MRCCVTVSKAASSSRSVLARKTANRYAEGLRRRLDSSELFRSWWKVGVQEHAKDRRLRHQVPQQAEPLGFHCDVKIADPGDVAARSAEAGDEAAPYGISAEQGNNGNRRRRGLGRPRGRFAANRNEHSDGDAHQFCCKLGQAVILPHRPAIVDRHGLALDETILRHSATESGHHIRALVGRSTTEEPDHRQRRLLRAHRNWPGSCRAAENCDELAPPHVRPRAQDKASSPVRLAHGKGLERALCNRSVNVAVGSFATEMVKAQARTCPFQLR